MTRQKPSKQRRVSSPICLRLTPEEKQHLQNEAVANRHPSVSAYIRSRIFRGGGNAETETRLSSLDRLQLLAKILGKLGDTSALRNLTDLAEAARIGVLPLTPETREAIHAACNAIMDIRDMLLHALGLKSTDRGNNDFKG